MYKKIMRKFPDNDMKLTHIVTSAAIAHTIGFGMPKESTSLGTTLMNDGL